MGGHLTSGGAINRSRLVQLLVYLARDEEAAYKRRAVSVLPYDSSWIAAVVCVCDWQPAGAGAGAPGTELGGRLQVQSGECAAARHLHYGNVCSLGSAA
jgi:hypothetical protein